MGRYFGAVLVQIDFLPTKQQSLPASAEGDFLHAQHAGVEAQRAGNIAHGEHQVIKGGDVHFRQPWR